MYTTINGWTKKRMKAKIRLKNNGKKARVGDRCLYETEDGNHCAAGCFIPDGHKAFDITLATAVIDPSASGLTDRCGYTDLLKVFPLPIEAMNVEDGVA